MRSGGRSARAPSGWIAIALLTSAINSRRLTILSRSLTNQISLAHIGAALALRCCPLPSCAARIGFFGFSKGQGQLFYEFCLGDAVPEDHMVRKIDTALDLSWLRSELAPHYSSRGAERGICSRRRCGLSDLVC